VCCRVLKRVGVQRLTASWHLPGPHSLQKCETHASATACSLASRFPIASCCGVATSTIEVGATSAASAGCCMRRISGAPSVGGPLIGIHTLSAGGGPPRASGATEGGRAIGCSARGLGSCCCCCWSEGGAGADRCGFCCCCCFCVRGADQLEGKGGREYGADRSWVGIGAIYLQYHSLCSTGLCWWLAPACISKPGRCSTIASALPLAALVGRFHAPVPRSIQAPAGRCAL